MVKYFKTVLSAFVLICSFVSCHEGHEAGDLLGMWRMDGSDTHYLKFSGHIVNVTVYGNDEVWGNYSREGDSIYIQCYSLYGRLNDTIIVEEQFGFKPFNDIRMRIETLNSERLVLSKDGKVWSFYQY